MELAADMLQRIRKDKGITIVWVEHIMGVLMRVVDRVVVLDHGEKIEPSMGLAPVIVAQVFDLVRRIRSEGYTVLIVEQNVRQVLKVADRAYLLEAGRIKAAGPAPPISPPATTSARRTWGSRCGPPLPA